MKITLFSILILLSFSITAQQKSDSIINLNSTFYSRLTVDFYESFFANRGMVRNFQGLKKGQIETSLLASTNLYSTTSYGLFKNVEIGVNYSTNDLKKPYLVGGQLTIHHAMTPKINIGLNLLINKDFFLNQISSTFLYGVDYNYKKLAFGTSLLINFDKLHNKQNLMVNSFNFWALYRIRPKGNIGLVFLNGRNPDYYKEEFYLSDGEEILPKTLFGYYDFLFKRSKLSIGVQLSRNNLMESGWFLFPILKYNFLIKR